MLMLKTNGSDERESLEILIFFPFNYVKTKVIIYNQMDGGKLIFFTFFQQSVKAELLLL